MKKILFAILICLTITCIFASCEEKEQGHKHEWSEWQSSKVATCTQDGINIRVCDNCGESQSIPISATGHTWSAWNTTKEASCTQDGLKERTCSCGEKETQTISALGHSWQNATCTESKSCKACGLSEGEALGHTCDIGTCTRCSESFYPTINLPTTPMTVWWNGSCSLKITDISYEFGVSGITNYLIVNFSGKKTSGNNGAYIGLRYRVLDQDGHVIHTDKWALDGYNVGDKFNDGRLYIRLSDIKGASEITIIISDY